MFDKVLIKCIFFFFSSRRRHTRLVSDWSSDVCSSDLQVWGDVIWLLPLDTSIDLGANAFVITLCDFGDTLFFYQPSSKSWKWKKYEPEDVLGS